MAVEWLYALNVFSIYISNAECVGLSINVLINKFVLES